MAEGSSTSRCRCRLLLLLLVLLQLLPRRYPSQPRVLLLLLC
jgi:hypothetical protein